MNEHVSSSVSQPGKGVQSFLKDPDIDQWFEQQSRERNRTKREALLHKIQQKVYDEASFMPIWQLGFLCVTGPRVAVSGLGLIPDYIYSVPYEDVRIEGVRGNHACGHAQTPGGRHYFWPGRRPGRGGLTRHVTHAGAGVSARRVVCVFCGPVESHVPLA
jgi:hypothetical protein